MIQFLGPGHALDARQLMGVGCVFLLDLYRWRGVASSWRRVHIRLKRGIIR